MDRKENIPPTQLVSKAQESPAKYTSTVVPAPPTAPGPGPLTAKAATVSRKRKSDAVAVSENIPEIDDDDPRLEHIDQSAQQVRAKVRRFVNSGAMEVGEFQAAIDVGSVQYHRFMKLNGTDAGSGSDMYHNAWKFFKKREIQGLKSTAPKKVKTAGNTGSKRSDALDVEGITLEGEENGQVSVYDTCDETRKKIHVLLRKDGITQAALLREIAKCFPAERKIQSKQLNDFLAKNGAMDGNTSCVFYGSYVLLEKLRVKEGKPKSDFRLEMEKLYGKSGVDLITPQNRPLFLGPGESAYHDKYGRLHIVSERGRDRVI